MKPQIKNEYTVAIARTIQEVNDLGDIWGRWNPLPTIDLDYYLTLVELKKEIISPYVIVLKRDNKPQGLLAGWIEEKKLEFKIGHKTLFSPKVLSISIPEGGILGKISPKNYEIYVSTLQGSIKNREADIVFFESIRTDSDLYQVGLNLPGILCKDFYPVTIPRYMLTLPPTYDDFFIGRKKKKKLRGLLRRLEKKFPDKVEIKVFQKPEHVTQLCSDIETISKKTYQYALSEGFADNNETRCLLNIQASQNKLRDYILYIDNSPVAFLTGYSHGNIHYDTATGFDPQYKKFELGTILMFREIADLCEDENIAYIDNGQGDQWYKRRFCDLSWEEATFFIFAPTLTGMKLNALRVFTGFADHLGGKMLTSLNLKEKWAKYKRNVAQKSIANEKIS